MKSFSRNKFKNIFQWGITPELNPVFTKRIILTNYLGFLFATNMSVTAIVLFCYKQYTLGIFTLLFVLSELSWPLFNYFKCYNISRLGMLVSSNILGFIVSVLLPGTGYNHGFFVMAGLPILLFSLNEKKSIFLGLMLPVVLYPLSEKLQHLTQNYGSVLEFSASTKMMIHMSIGGIYVLLIFLMFLFLSKENARSEEKLKSALLKVEEEKKKIQDLNIQLEEQRARSFSSAKFAALGEMASGIAHEINNPMTIINVNTEHVKYLLEEGLSKEKAFERLDIISKTVKRVAQVIDAMRSFSREGNNDAFELESLEKIIEETLTFCSQRFKNHEVKLEIKMVPTDIVLNCRSVQISQVLLNLLNNSFDAIEDLPEKWILLEATNSLETDKIVISVTDSGQGIPEDMREKIFQPFYTTKPVGKGTGLGLSLSRKIVEDHGGSIAIDSHSRNTRFVIEI